jgi:CheY-like chemotaxis protein
LLLDLALPDGNGLDLAREAPAHSRIIALSADDSPETLLRCREAGCDSVVRKSRGPSELRRLLEDISECVIPSPAAGSKEQHELADRYLEFLAESRVAMQRAWHHSDFKTLRRVAHRLRGTAIHFGYASVGANAQALGVALAAENKKQVNERLGLLAQIICEAVETYHLKTKGRMPTEE